MKGLDAELAALQESIVRADVDIKAAIDELHLSTVDDQREFNKVVKDIRAKMSSMGRLVGRLESGSGRQRSGGERTATERSVAAHRAALEQSEGRLRRATLRGLRRLEESGRSALLEGGGGVKLRGVGESLAEESGRATAGLGALLSTMGGQVEASTANLNALLGSSSVLKETESEFATMGAAISSSGKLLSKWERREITDKALFLLAFLLFYITAAYIVRKRLGALWVFSWI